MTHLEIAGEVLQRRRQRILIATVHVKTVVFYTTPLIVAIVFAAVYPHCLLGFDAVDTFPLPDFRNLSNSEKSELLNGQYKLPQGYFLEMVANDYSKRYKLCVLVKPSDDSSACMQIGHLNRSIPCNRSMRAECLPGAIVDSFFGISMWNMDKASVQYLTMMIPTSGGEVSSQSLTNTTLHLSDVWYRTLGCQGVIALGISSLVAAALGIIIHCGICVGCYRWKSKRRHLGERTRLIPPNIPIAKPRKGIQKDDTSAVQPRCSDRQQSLLQDIEEKVVPKVAADWEQLAIHLGVETTCINIIKRNNASHCENSCREMFRSWMTKEKDTGGQPRTRDTVVQAIRRAGREDLADQLREK